MSDFNENVATVSCGIDVYPISGGAYSIQGGQVLSCTVQKSVEGEARGTFTFVLAPGGPWGVDSALTWVDVLPVMSTVVIAMQRGSRSNVILVGVIEAAGEDLRWGRDVRRQQIFRGSDCSIYFLSFAWAVFSTLGILNTTLIGEALGILGAGVPSIFSPALFGQTSSGSYVNPIAIAQALYKLMVYPGGILGKTRLNYGNNTTIPLQQAFSTIWESYLPDTTILFGDFLATFDGRWWDKFKDLLEWPFYQFFVTTSPRGAYLPPSTGPSTTGLLPSPPTTATGSLAGGDVVLNTSVAAQAPEGFYFSSASLPGAIPASPVVVARVNPLPALTLGVKSPTDPGVWGNMDLSRWNALPLFQPDSGILSSRPTFSMDEVGNFFYINPKYFAASALGTGTSIVPTAYLFLTAGDPASIMTYGYKPRLMVTHWLYDPQYAALGVATNAFAQTIATLLARLCSYYSPTPLMSRSVVTLPLRPDVLPGMRFRYAPSKGPQTWDYYIDSATWTYNYGARSISTTTLSLSRGLPTQIYQDGGAANSLLRAIHLGDAQRTASPENVEQAVGEYTFGAAGGLTPTLSTIVPLNNASVASFLGNLGEIYVSPQMK